MSVHCERHDAIPGDPHVVQDAARGDLTLAMFAALIGPA
jgi:hypothetical protein